MDTKMAIYLKGVHLFQTIILGIHVSFRRCTLLSLNIFPSSNISDLLPLIASSRCSSWPGRKIKPCPIHCVSSPRPNTTYYESYDIEQTYDCIRNRYVYIYNTYVCMNVLSCQIGREKKPWFFKWIHIQVCAGVEFIGPQTNWMSKWLDCLFTFIRPNMTIMGFMDQIQQKPVEMDHFSKMVYEIFTISTALQNFYTPEV